MWAYIVRRLLLLVITLWGITLVTFGIIQLTPGDPAELRIQKTQSSSGSAGLSKEDIERIRAHFGLDKPAFFNVSPTSRRSNLLERVKDYESENEQTVRDVPQRLREIGAAGLAPAIELLGQADGEQAKRLLSALPELARGLSRAPKGDLDKAGWIAWWTAEQGSLNSEAAAQAVDTLLTAGRPEGIAELAAAVGTLATPHLLAELDTEDLGRLRLVTQALGLINRHPNWALADAVATDSDEGRERLARYRYLWNNWNTENGPHYTDLTLAQRAGRLFTETQYGTWMAKLFVGDFGDSFKHNRPVLEVLWPRMAITVQLSVFSIFLAYLVAIPLGIFSAARPYTMRDKVLTVTLFVLYSLPTFWVGNLLIMFFTGGSVFPFNLPYASKEISLATIGEKGMGTYLYNLALPLLCFTYGSFAYISRQMRASMMEVIRADFIRTARAKGLSEKVVIFKHALRNSLIPILTIMANVLPILIGGSVIIEQIFTIDGMGSLAFQSVLDRDYPVTMAVTFFSAVLTLIGILLSDLSYALVDPRITYD